MRERKLHRYVRPGGQAMRADPVEAALRVAENEGWPTALPMARKPRTSGNRAFGRHARPR